MKTDPSLPLFHQPWFLDIVCAEGLWEMLTLESGGRLEAQMPLYYKKKGPFTYITQPPFCQFHGPLLFGTEKLKQVKKLSTEDKRMTKLVDLLEEKKIASINQNWSPEQVNWYAFYKRGFSMRVRYTYQLTDLQNSDELWNGFDNRLRTDIRKAEKLYTLEESTETDILYSIQEKTFQRQKQSVPFSYTLWKNLFLEAETRGQGKMLIARTEEGKPAAAAYFIWDDKTIYYLLGGADPELRGGAPQSLLLWLALKSFADSGKVFDFEGSMVPGIEKFFRSFGGFPQPYFQVWKHRSRLFKWLKGE